MAGLSEEQIAILAQVDERLASLAPEPKQRTRAVAQGLTFGTADEIEAGVRSLFPGQTYSGALGDIRGGLDEYREDYPVSSALWEIGGAALPALAATLLTGGSSTPASAAQLAPAVARTGLLSRAGTGTLRALGVMAPARAPAALLPRIVQAAGYGAVAGGAYGFGAGEGGLENRASSALSGALLGTFAAPIAGEAIRATGGVARWLIDSARRRLGRRGGTIVENEIQRLASATGRTADEIVDDLMNGKILAENSTIAHEVAALRLQGGLAGAAIEEALPRRAASGREVVMARMQSGLASSTDDNVRRGVAAARAGERATERAAYAQFRGVEASEDVAEALADALRRVPSAADEVTTALTAETGLSPFFTIADDGALTFSRFPTVAEAETVRRSLSNRASSLFRSGQGAAGESVSEVEKQLRRYLDDAVPELADVRATASIVRGASESFTLGQRALSQSPDQVAIDFAAARSRGEEAVAAYRNGVMDAYRSRMSTGSRASMMSNLNDPARREGEVLRLVFPEDQLDDILRQVDVAAGSQNAVQSVLRGSPTAGRTAAAERSGGGVSAAELADVLTGSPRATLEVMGKIVRSARPDISEFDRMRIASILLETDPQVLRRALVDESGMAALQRRVVQTFDMLNRAGRGGVIPASDRAADVAYGPRIQ